jgi:hypothetical protein
MKKTKVTYIGRRIFSDDSIVHAFLHNGEEVAFGKVKWCYIGTNYEAMSGAKNRLQISARPPDLGEASVDEKTLTQWKMLDAAAAQFARRKSASRKLRKHPELVALAEKLKPLLAGLSLSQKTSVVEFIVDEIEREERERMSMRMRKKIDQVVRNSKHRVKAAEKAAAKAEKGQK